MLNSLQEKWLQLNKLKSLYCAIILPYIQMLISSGTNNYQTDHQHSFWVNLQLAKELLRMNLRRDFLQNWTPHQDRFLWQSRMWVCLTLLCITVLWSPLWLKHTQHSYKVSLSDSALYYWAGVQWYSTCEVVLNFHFDQATSNPQSIINIIYTGGKTCVWLQMKFYFYFIKSKWKSERDQNKR